MMKAVLDVVRFNLADVITTSGDEVVCANPDLPVGVADGMAGAVGCGTQMAS